MLVKYSYAHENVAYLNMIHNKIAHSEGKTAQRNNSSPWGRRSTLA